MSRHYFQLLLAITLIVISNGCRKDHDTTAPLVQVIMPAAGTTFQLPDTLTIQVSVTDDHELERLVIDVLNADGVPVATTATALLSGTSAMITREFIINDERLLSGNYTIAARASDGTNEGSGFLDINLNEIPLRLRAVFLSPVFSNTSSTIQKLDSTGQLSEFITVQDLNGVAVDSYSQHLMVAGSQFQPFTAIPTSTASNTWQYAGPGNDAPEQFTTLSVDKSNGHTYFATRDGFIRGFIGSGAQVFTAQSLVGYRTGSIVALDERVITWQKAIVGPEQQVVSYTAAGTVLEILPVGFERVALFRRTLGRLILFANENGDGAVKDLNITEAGSPTRYAFTAGMIREALQLDANTYIVALSDRIVRYSYASNIIQEIASGFSVDAMEYDPATGTLFAAQGGTLFAMDANTGSITNTFSTGLSIGHVGVLNNR